MSFSLFPLLDCPFGGLTRSASALLPFFGEGSPTKIDYRKTVGTLILTCLLEDLADVW